MVEKDDYKIVFEKVNQAAKEQDSLQSIKINEIIVISEEIKKLSEIINEKVTDEESFSYSSS